MNRLIQMIAMYIILASCKCCFKKSTPYHKNLTLPELATQLDDLSTLSTQEIPLGIFLEQEKKQLINQLQDRYSTLWNKGKSNSGSTPPTPQNNLKLEEKLKTLNHEFENLQKVLSLILTPTENEGTRYEELTQVQHKIKDTIQSKHTRITQLETRIQEVKQNTVLQEKEKTSHYINTQEERIKFHKKLLGVYERVERELNKERHEIETMFDTMLTV